MVRRDVLSRSEIALCEGKIMSKLLSYLVLTGVSLVGLAFSTAAPVNAKSGGCATGCCSLCGDDCAGCAPDCDCCTTGVCVCNDCGCACCAETKSAVAKGSRTDCTEACCAVKTPSSATDKLLAASGVTVASTALSACCADKACGLCADCQCECVAGCDCCTSGDCVCDACECLCCSVTK